MLKIVETSRIFSEAEPKQMSILNLTKYLNRDLDKVLFEDGKHMGKLKERNGYQLDLKSLSEEEWKYLVYTAHEAYLAGAERVARELNKQADEEVRQAQRKAEEKIYNDLSKMLGIE